MREPYGLIGVFATPEAIQQAAAQLRRLGLHGVEAYTPYPVEGLGELPHCGVPG